jgi:hypothetical protein
MAKPGGESAARGFHHPRWRKIALADVAGDSSRERKQSLAVTSCEDQPPAMAVRIASLELYRFYHLHSALLVFAPSIV